MSEFHEKLTRLQKDGTAFKDETLNEKVDALIYDAPTRGSSCEQCTIKGQYVKHRAVFTNQSQEKISSRTEEVFNR